MTTIQIHDIPDEDVEVLSRAAKAAGMSLQAYLRQQVIALARRPTKAEAMAAAREALDRDPGPGADENTLLEAPRAMRAE